MEQIKDTVWHLLEEMEKKKTFPATDEPQELLKKVLAKKAMRHVKLYNFRKGVLTVKVDSSVWLYYLNLQKEELLERLSKENNQIKDIRFSLGG